MRTLLVIGIGTGHPDHVTVQAVAALNRVDVVFVFDKGEETARLRDLRQEICARHIAGRAYRFVEMPDPPRDRTAGDYAVAVAAWHAQRVGVLEAMIAAELPETSCGAFLVWGDPSLFDSTIRIVDALKARGRIAFEHQVIAGITSPQALTAAHRIPLNRLGTPVLVTTGRQLAAHGLPPDADAVVLLDGQCAFEQIADDVEIFWGAYLGSPDEIRIAGALRDVAPEIVRARAAARQRHGWIMDTYLLRRRSPDPN